MKKLIGITTVLLMMALVVNAQELQKPKWDKLNYTPEQIATLQSKKMALDLDLNESQQSKIYDLKLKEAQDRQAAMETKKQNIANGIMPTSDEKFAMQSAKLDKQKTFKVEMKSILTKEQYEKWEKMCEKRILYKVKKGDLNKRNKPAQP